MADYAAFPLWAVADDDPAADDEFWFGNLHPGSLPLSASLVVELQEWAEQHDSLLGPDFRWPSPQAKVAFVGEGRRLLALVREDLGSDYVVGYVDETTGRLEYE